MLGTSEGKSEGSRDIDGVILGITDSDGWNEGVSDGMSLGAADMLGWSLGCAETDGCAEGVWDGASLWGSAPEMTKSLAVADVAFDIAFAFVESTVLVGIVPSKFKTAMPLTR